jgi:protoporphyrinogen IX oxidase
MHNTILTGLIVFHVFGVIMWVGSLLLISSLMRLAPDEVGASREALIVAARRLFRMSANIGAVVAILFGIGVILAEPQVLRQGWLHIKLAFVAIMLVCHFWLYRRIIGLENDPGSASRGGFAMIHGVVSLALLVILAMVFFQPFSH